MVEALLPYLVQDMAFASLAPKLSFLLLLCRKSSISLSWSVHSQIKNQRTTRINFFDCLKDFLRIIKVREDGKLVKKERATKRDLVKKRKDCIGSFSMDEFSTSLYLLKVTYISSSGSCISWSCPSPPLSAISAATLCLWKKNSSRTMRLIYDREKGGKWDMDEDRRRGRAA